MARENYDETRKRSKPIALGIAILAITLAGGWAMGNGGSQVPGDGSSAASSLTTPLAFQARTSGKAAPTANVVPDASAAWVGRGLCSSWKPSSSRA